MNSIINYFESMTVNQLANIVEARRMKMRKIQQSKIYHRYWNDGSPELSSNKVAAEKIKVKKDLDKLDEFIEIKTEK